MEQSNFPLRITVSAHNLSLTSITMFNVSNTLLHTASKDTIYLLSDGLVVIFIQQGTIELTNNGKYYKSDKNDTILLHPGFITQFHAISEDCRYIEITIPMGSIADLPSPLNVEIVNMVHDNFIISFPNDKFIDLFQYVTLYHEAFLHHTDEDAEVLRALFILVMTKLSNSYKRLEKEQHKTLSIDKLTEKFFYQLAIHCKTQRSINFYAQELNLTPRHLSRTIRATTGRSPVTWINDVILWEIRSRLKTTDATIFEIANDLQFSSPSNMVLFFRQHMGITPLQYRKQAGW